MKPRILIDQTRVRCICGKEQVLLGQHREGTPDGWATCDCGSRLRIVNSPDWTGIRLQVKLPEGNTDHLSGFPRILEAMEKKEVKK